MPARKKKKTRAVATRATGELALPAELQELFGTAINRDRATSKGAGGWPFVKTSGPNFTIDGRVCADPFEVIAVAAVRQNLYYEGAYDPATPSSPTCYAIDTAGDETVMAPPAELASKVSDLCSKCVNNAYGSAGKGKACRNTVKVAVVPADRKDHSEGEGSILSIPPTSLKAWGAYTRALNEQFGRPLFAATTIFSKEMGKSGGFKILPSLGTVLNDRAMLETLNDRASKDVWAMLLSPPPVGGGDAPAGPARTRRRRKVQK